MKLQCVQGNLGLRAKQAPRDLEYFRQSDFTTAQGNLGLGHVLHILIGKPPLLQAGFQGAARGSGLGSLRAQCIGPGTDLRRRTRYQDRQRDSQHQRGRRRTQCPATR